MRRLFPAAAASAAFLIILTASASADYKQAVALYMQGKYDKAIQELKPDLDQNPDWEFGHRLAGLCYLNLKNNALAVSSLTRAVQLKSTAFSTYFGLAQANFNMQRYDNCIQALNQGEQFIAKEKDPAAERQRFHRLRGYAYFRLQKYQDAANELTAALRSGTGDWSDYSQLGIAYYNLNRYDEAVQTLQKALSMKPGQSATTEFLAKAYFKRGVAALTAKQYGPAVENLQQARELNPKDGYVHYNLAEAHLFQQRYGEAEKALNQALELMPRSAEVYQRLGFVYEKQKKWDLSLKAYNRANELNPSPVLKDAIARVSESRKQ